MEAGEPTIAGAAQAESSPAGRRLAESSLTLNLAATPPGVRLVQVCLQDHTSYESPHVHIQMHFSDATRSPWLQLDGVSQSDLQEAILAICAPCMPRGNRVRLHLHANARRAEKRPTAKECAAALPRHSLSVAEADTLCGVACPVCLEGFHSGESLLVIPCDGLHKGHSACISRWLEQSNTCPSCRHKLPADGNATEALPALQDVCAREIARITELAEKAPSHHAGPACMECSFVKQPFDERLSSDDLTLSEEAGGAQSHHRRGSADKAEQRKMDPPSTRLTPPQLTPHPELSTRTRAAAPGRVSDSTTGFVRSLVSRCVRGTLSRSSLTSRRLSDRVQ